MASLFSDDKILILGASSDTGLELARQLRKDGVEAGLISRPGERFERVKSETGFPSAKVESIANAEIEDAVKTLGQTLGPITGAVNLLGTMILKPAHLTTAEDWAETISVNLDSSFAFLKSVLRVADRRRLSMVFVSSAAARTGIPNHEAIAAAKAGVEGLALSAAATYASRGYRFNVVAPGLVKTKLTDAMRANEQSLKASQEMHPLRRLGEAGDVAAAIRWLLGSDSEWVTGQVIGVDGGLARLRTRVKV